MEELIIVGAGGFGRELLQWVKDINKVKNKWIIKGFIDDNRNALNGYECNYQVLGSIQDWTPGKNEVFACAIAEPKTKENLVNVLKNKGAKFTEVIHPTCIIGDHNIIGEGFVAYPYARISVNVKIGNFVTLLLSIIGHDVHIGDFSTISTYCAINGKVKIGERVFFGTHAMVIPGRTIGDDAYIGAGSVVITDINSKVKVIGNPARKINF
jgi:sugar O-acyltransferase (sialic acid O-acetyltransferase NeuD family)